MTTAWVLWHSYSDWSGAHVERVYLDKARAEEDFKLLTEGEGKLGAGEWKLDEVPLFGSAAAAELCDCGHRQHYHVNGECSAPVGNETCLCPAFVLPGVARP